MKKRSLLVITFILMAGVLSIASLLRNSGQVQAASTTGTSGTPNSKVVAYYFHGNTRCVTCRKIEALSHEVVTSNFSPQLKANQLEWQSVNFEQPGNEHLFVDYKLVTSSLVIVTYKNGKQTDYRNLTEVWKLVNNDPAFRSYVKNGIQAAIERVQ